MAEQRIRDLLARKASPSEIAQALQGLEKLELSCAWLRCASSFHLDSSHAIHSATKVLIHIDIKDREATAIAEALKVNSSLQQLDVGSALSEVMHFIHCQSHGYGRE